jgi:hypothetical protein
VKFRFAAIGAACAIAAAAPVFAGPNPPSAVVTVTSTTLSFTAGNLSNAALTSSPLTASGSITFTTTPGGPGGTVTVTPMNLPGTPAGTTLDARDFTLVCKHTGGADGFVAAAPATFNGPTTCGTLTQGKSGATSTFSIELLLNDTITATAPFEAASYLGTFTVSATAS